MYWHCLFSVHVTAFVYVSLSLSLYVSVSLSFYVSGSVTVSAYILWSECASVWFIVYGWPCVLGCKVELETRPVHAVDLHWVWNWKGFWWDKVVCTVECPAVGFSMTQCEHRGELILSGQTRNLLQWCYHSCPIERRLKHCVCVCVCVWCVCVFEVVCVCVCMCVCVQI